MKVKTFFTQLYELTRGSLTKPSSPAERTVDKIITGFSFPWKISAVPTVISLMPSLWHIRAMVLHCNLYGDTTPISDCFVLLLSFNNRLIYSTTTSASPVL